MRRLWVRLTIAFAVVILVTVGVVGLLAGLTAGQAFRAYVAYSGTLPHQALIEGLAGYYETHGDWSGVGQLLDRASALSAPAFGGRRPPPDQAPLQFVLAGADGRVVYDGAQGRLGRRLNREEQAAAQDIEVGGETVGQLVVSLPVRSNILGPLEEIFVARLRRWLIAGGLLAGGLGLLLGLALSRSLTAPLQRMAMAARAIARRDFSRRVEVEGSDEMADVARAFNDMAATLEASERQRQNMVADVAHELRTPLSVLQGNLRAILDDVYPLDKAEVSRLYDETRLLSRLVDDLRELALADAGQLGLNLQPADVGDVARSTAESFAPAAEAQEVELRVEMAGDLPQVQADPDRLAQILRNLLVNALRHTPRGGSVVITGRRTEDAVELAVADTGEGIAPQDQARVFDRFWRADRARTRDGQWVRGTGLGLSIAQSLVEAHGGHIWLETKAGEGSTFRFTLPVRSSPEAGRRET
ncbi:MAG: ATP-binding protein [Anaerolineae bacterium]|nr:ATP-binding protein [Anaerolineae bacterium]